MYLITQDYKGKIQTAELNAITQSDIANRYSAERIAQEEIRESLIQKYDLSIEFQDTATFLISITYKASNRIYLTADAFSATTIYTINQMVLQAGKVYSSIAGSAAHAFNAAEWNLYGSQYDFFFVAYPYPVFEQNKLYLQGDKVFWKNKVYEAQMDSIPDTHDSDLQAIDINNIQQGNILPDDRNTKAAIQMWGVGVDFSFAGITPTNIAKTAWAALSSYSKGDYVSYQGQNYIATAASVGVTPGTSIYKWLPVLWTFGDNRNPRVIEHYINLTKYKLSSTVAPNNVPEAWHNAWIDTKKSLKDYAEGHKTLDLPLILPIQGQPIRFGGVVKQQNNW